MSFQLSLMSNCVCLVCLRIESLNDYCFVTVLRNINCVWGKKRAQSSLIRSNMNFCSHIPFVPTGLTSESNEIHQTGHQQTLLTVSHIGLIAESKKIAEVDSSDRSAVVDLYTISRPSQSWFPRSRKETGPLIPHHSPSSRAHTARSREKRGRGEKALNERLH
jgi:hypothetical protein